MLTQYLSDPKVQSICLHNTTQWQVSELMGGFACEIVLKTRWIDEETRSAQGLSLHACYPSLYMQGEEANDFLAEFRKAQVHHTPHAVDELLLERYRDVVSL